MTKIKRQIFDDVLAERVRQDALVKTGKHPFSCADAEIDGAEKARVLGEEFGEVCKASYEFDHPSAPAESTDHFFRILELIQLAAVAVAWAESLPVPQPSTPQLSSK